MSEGCQFGSGGRTLAKDTRAVFILGLLRESDTAHEVSEARVGAQGVEARVNL